MVDYGLICLGNSTYKGLQKSPRLSLAENGTIS